MRVALLAVALFLAAPAFGQASAPLPQKLARTDFQGVIADTGSVYVAGQPTADALRDMASNGVTTVISVRTEAEMSNRKQVPYDEAALAKELGITFVNVPMGGPDSPYTPEALAKVMTAIDSSKGKVLLHCTVGWRASHVWAAYLVKDKGLAYDEAVRQASAINLNGYTPPNATSTPMDGLLGKTPVPAKAN
ncbi:MAG TPA: sulfur transferase domain-containing protein [Hyphomonadaceae bacterium]|nr:sulfur transferase domain-containing protein [Hyphomonadaceae bacterium]